MTQTQKLSKKHKVMRDVFDFLTNKNKEIILKNGEVEPIVTVVLYDNDKGLNLLPIPLRDTDNSMERKLLLSSVARHMAEENLKVEMFISMAEGWGAKIDPKDYVKDDFVRPSENPSKREVFCAGAIDRDGNSVDIFFEIKRSEGKVDLVPLEKESDAISWKTKEEIAKRGKSNILLEVAWSEYNRYRGLVKKEEQKSIQA